MFQRAGVEKGYSASLAFCGKRSTSTISGSGLQLPTSKTRHDVMLNILSLKTRTNEIVEHLRKFER